MKKWKLKIVKPLFITAILVTTFSCGKNDSTGDNNNPGNNGNLAAFREQVNNLPKEPLSIEEINSLGFMREEEKLARDVYTFLYTKWGSNIFTNISASEQTHTDAVLLLLNKYNLTDPVNSNPPGVFSNSLLQQLYNQLTMQGNTATQSYITGATIEDLDLFDLKNALLTTDNQDIRLVYEMLAKGSRNHLRSFYRNIQNSGSVYAPQYISQDEFDAIINSSMETGF